MTKPKTTRGNKGNVRKPQGRICLEKTKRINRPEQQSKVQKRGIANRGVWAGRTNSGLIPLILKLDQGTSTKKRASNRGEGEEDGITEDCAVGRTLKAKKSAQRRAKSVLFWTGAQCPAREDG